MPNLRDPETRAAVELIAKYIVIVVVGIWTLCVGTDLLDRQKKSLELDNAALSVQSVPTAATEIEFTKDGPAATSGEICDPQGIYRITNTGNLPILVGPTVFEIFEIPTIAIKPDHKIISYSLEVVLKGRRPILSEEMEKPEMIGVANTYERVFGYSIRRKPNHYYVLVVTGSGHLPDGVSNDDGIRIVGEFGPNDLRHAAFLSKDCPPYQQS